MSNKIKFLKLQEQALITRYLSLITVFFPLYANFFYYINHLSHCFAPVTNLVLYFIS
ncbi:hypothetical protein ES705_39977 [subsurface metagenome]